MADESSSSESTTSAADERELRSTQTTPNNVTANTQFERYLNLRHILVCQCGIEEREFMLDCPHSSMLTRSHDFRY